MKTVVTESPIEAAAYIRAGGLVAFPTETVYGLGANAFDEAVVEKVFSAKGRPADNPLIVHISDEMQLAKLSAEISDSAESLIQHFFPGPLTIVVKKSALVPSVVSAGLDTVAVRMPAHELANCFIDACGVPLVAPSANLSGRPSATTWESVLEDLDGRIDCILKGETSSFGIESTVIDCTGESPLILRSGQTTLEQIRAIVPNSDYAVISDEIEIRSPGLKHRHYSPRAKVLVLEGSVMQVEGQRAAFIGLSEQSASFRNQKVCSTVNDYAHSLYEFFRECDRDRIETIYCESVEETGIGVALMDRIRRAAEG